MLRTTVNTRPIARSRLAVAASASVLAMLASACSTAPVEQYQPAWRLDGAPVQRDFAPIESAEAATAGWAAQEEYEYRGGRDPKTGRADIQM